MKRVELFLLVLNKVLKFINVCLSLNFVHFWQLFLQSFFCLPTPSFCLDYNYKDIRPLHFFPWVPGTPVFFHQFALISLCFSYCSIFKVVDLLYNLNFLVRLASQFFILDTEFFISAHPRGLLPEQPRLFSGMC